MREITPNEYLDKACVHYAVLGTTESGEQHVVGSFGNEVLAQDFINSFIEFCGEGTENFFEIVRIVPERTTTPEPYTREDIMQAVCAALMFEESIGFAARDTMEKAMVNHTTLVGSVTLFPGAGNSVSMSPLAAHLLATAQNELPRRGIGEPHEGGRTTYDLRAP